MMVLIDWRVPELNEIPLISYKCEVTNQMVRVEQTWYKDKGNDGNPSLSHM